MSVSIFNGRNPLLVSIFIFSEKEGLIYKYKKEYMQYSYYNNEVHLGVIKFSANLKKIYINNTLKTFPYDGVEISLTKNKKIIYKKIETPNLNLAKKTINNNIYEKGKSFLYNDIKIDNEDSHEERSMDFSQQELIEGEDTIYKKIVYFKRELSNEKYNKILKKINSLEEKSFKYFNEQPKLSSIRVYNMEYITSLDYVTDIELPNLKIIYFNEDIKELKNNRIEVYLLAEEIKKELEEIILEEISLY